MEIKTKYAVLQDEYANWIIQQAQKTYSSLFTDESKQKDLDHHLNTIFEKDTFVQSQNDFTFQTIMAFYNEEPIASLELNTSPRKRDFFKNEDKPLFINKIFYTDESGLNALLEKVKTISSQKNYSLVYGEILAARKQAIEVIEENGFEITSKESTLENTDLPTVIFKLTN